MTAGHTTGTAHELPRAAADWLRLHGREASRLVLFAPPTTRNRVFRVPGGEPLVLKLHRQRPTWAAEVHALRHWTTTGDGFAELVDTIEPALGIVTRCLDGQPLEHLDVPETEACSVWHQAGRVAAAVEGQAVGTWFGPVGLSGEPAEPPATDPVDYMQANVRSWLLRARACSGLRADEERLGAWALANCTSFATAVPRPVNRDFTPGNWLVRDGGKLQGVVDLEDMRWGTRAEGLAHLWTKFAWEAPACWAAFLEGCGQPPTPVFRQQLCAAAIAHGFATLTLGAWQGSARHTQRGHAILGRIDQILTREEVGVL